MGKVWREGRGGGGARRVEWRHGRIMKGGNVRRMEGEGRDWGNIRSGWEGRGKDVSKETERGRGGVWE